MASVRPYPHYEINVIDNSIATVAYEEILPVHRPLWPMRAQEGPVAFPTWCGTYLQAKNLFGEQTFKASSKYFSKQAAFLLDTLTFNGAFICRIADSNASSAIAILEAHVETISSADAATKGIVQYELDENGARILDEEGNYVPKMNGDTPVKEAGVRITYKLRYSLQGSEESLEDLSPYTSTTGAHVYPLFAFAASYVGEYGNDLAFSFSYKKSENTEGDVKYYKSVFYTFTPARREYASTTVKPHRDKYGRLFVSFASNPKAIDQDTGLIYSMENICNRAYEADGYVLPYTIYTFEDNFAAIGNQIIQAEIAAGNYAGLGCDLAAYDEDGLIVVTEDPDTHEMSYSVDSSKLNIAAVGHMINVISGINLKKNFFAHVEIDTTSSGAVVLADDSVLYLRNGSDGNSISDATVMEGIRALCDKSLQPMIVDKARFPFTHMYDVGYDMKTKYALLEFLDVRDDIGVSLSTQVLLDNGDGRSLDLNDQAEDEANGEALRAYALLMRESVLMGTDCCRAAVYCHAGYLAGGNYLEPMPFTYWDAHQHAMYGRTQYMSAIEPRGLPLAYNELFKVKSLKWTNYDPEGQSRVWDSGLNYVQYADMSRIHFPALRTVYRAETSVLVDQWFVDAVIYTKHVVRKAWAKFSGRNDSTVVLQGAIRNYLNSELTKLYAGKYTFTVTVYQTEDEVLLGYVQHVKIAITSGAQFRVLVVDIECNREGFSAE